MEFAPEWGARWMPAPVGPAGTDMFWMSASAADPAR
jgi:hypothetical protein